MKMQKKKKKEKTEKKKKKRRRHRSASRVLCPTNKKLFLPLPFPLFPKVCHLPGGADLWENGEGEGGWGRGQRSYKSSGPAHLSCGPPDQASWECQPGPIAPELSDIESIYQAMMLGLRDYVNKTGFPSVVIGLSGGVDSALTAAVAADALGPERVHTLMMPSPYTSAHSLEDAKACAEAIGVRYDIVGIEPAMEAFRGMTVPLFGNRKEDVTEENIQSRARAVVLMAVSNKLGGMVVTTGNKSEMAVGYATLYGDMCGGYNVLKDVYKTTVFELCHWRNAHLPEGALGRKGKVIPERIITKPPSAELRPEQKDSDSLPPYPVLDAILKGLIERDLSAEELAAEGHDLATVNKVWRLLEGAEYKRRQAPPGVKITSRIISRERRYPIVNVFLG